MKDGVTPRGRAKVRGVVLTLAAFAIVGTLQMPAFAGAAFSKPLEAHGTQGVSYSLDAHFTESYRNKGWVQSYGVVKVRNRGRHKLHITCDITVKTGGVPVAFDSVDLVVPGLRSRSVDWGAEGGDESGKVTGAFRCHN